MFNLPAMTRAAVAAIDEFARSHAQETFYAFAIDADMLCLNSIEKFGATLADYRERFPGCYLADEEVRCLRENTGDWEYQGFFQMDRSHGFDYDLYDEHYELAGSSGDGHAPGSDYANAMSALVLALKRENAFAALRQSPDFSVTWVDHDY